MTGKLEPREHDFDQNTMRAKGESVFMTSDVVRSNSLTRHVPHVYLSEAILYYCSRGQSQTLSIFIPSKESQGLERIGVGPESIDGVMNSVIRGHTR
jgi:hypothetical protein